MYFILKVKSEIRGEKDGIRALKKGEREVGGRGIRERKVQKGKRVALFHERGATRAMSERER